jgi:archaellum component FlaC
MTQIQNDDDGLPELSNRKLLQILMQEIADVRGELKEDSMRQTGMIMQEIVDVRSELKEDIGRLDTKIDGVSKDLHKLKHEINYNYVTFIKNHDDLDKRVTVLELAR